MEMDVSLSFQIALRRWPVILIVVLLGVVVGCVVSHFQAPLYQAETVIAVNIDYGVTEPLELIVEDRAINRVITYLQSDEVLEAVIDRLPEEIRDARNWQIPSDLRFSIQLDQRLAEWGLLAIDTDPLIAAEVSQTWAEVSLEKLDQAKVHAWRAAGMLDGALDVACDFVANPYADYPRRIWQCQVSALNVAPEDLEGTLQNELESSHGVLPNISYELMRAVSIPENPVLWGRGLLIASGGLAGLILGIIAVLVYSQDRDSKRRGE